MCNTCNKVKLSITGMKCAKCVATVESALGNVEGVTNTNVDLANKTAVVVGNASLQSTLGALKSAGYDATEITLDDEKKI